MCSGWQGGTGGRNDAVQGHVIGHVGAVINCRVDVSIELKTSHDVVLRRVPLWAGRGSGGMGGGRSQVFCSGCSGGGGSMGGCWFMGLDVVGVMRTPIRIGDQLWGGGRSREVFSYGGNVFTDGLQLGVHGWGNRLVPAAFSFKDLESGMGCEC